MIIICFEEIGDTYTYNKGWVQMSRGDCWKVRRIVLWSFVMQSPWVQASIWMGMQYGMLSSQEDQSYNLWNVTCM